MIFGWIDMNMMAQNIGTYIDILVFLLNYTIFITFKTN